ncbi:MAG TPA: 2-hydroxy-acid oxidase [Octadecabacter sp.]|nr:2-hydroxy-acid oxidase [Octadecabacter sp.]
MTIKTEQELAEAVRGATGPLHIRGGGTRDIGNPVIGEALHTAGLSGITLYEPGALTIVAQAGTPVADIEAALEAEDQRLAFEPMDHRTLLGSTGTPTIGGIVASNASGPRRISVGACRDHLLGVRFVDGAGTIIKNGGRVMKNVTGYDLVKLMAGSYGTLGVLSEVALKVLPKPETSATLVLQGLSLPDSIAAMSAALGSPFEVTGAAQAGDDTYLRIEGFEASVSYRLGQLQTLLGHFGETSPLHHDDSTARWHELTSVAQFADAPVVWRVAIKPSDAPKFVDCLTQTVGFEVSFDWGGGLLWIAAREPHLEDAARCHEDEGRRSDPSAGAEVIHTNLQHNAGLIGGHATLIKAPQSVRSAVPAFQPENPTVTALSQGLRNKFDPRGILNAGLMG